MLRALVNTRLARSITPEFEKIQDEYLTELLAQKKVTKLTELTPIAKQIYLWQGDITTLAVEAIVNAANQMMLGCYRPNCNCIDNAIHTFAGIQLRNECYAVMKNVGRFVNVGQVLPTKAYNLPSNYVLHVAGPYVKNGELTPEHEQLLKAAYQNCLKLAADNDLKSLAFCCISTGEFHFPNERAAQIAVETVTDFLAQTDSEL